MIDLDSSLHRAPERVESQGEHHELLEVGGVLGVAAAVDDVEHRRRERDRLAVVEVVVQGSSAALRGSVRRGERDAKNGVRAEIALVVCAV